MNIIALIPVIPVLFYLVDAYHEKDIKKGLLNIAAFALFVIAGFLLLFLVGWTFALWTPVLLLLMLSIKPKNKPKKLSSSQEE